VDIAIKNITSHFTISSEIFLYNVILLAGDYP